MPLSVSKALVPRESMQLPPDYLESMHGTAIREIDGLVISRVVRTDMISNVVLCRDLRRSHGRL